MEIRRLPVDGYEEVYRATDPRAGLNAFIAVHDTTLGPALGGCRMWRYTREEDAVTDVLRLSEGMSYKSAVARTGLGGGKAVIVGDPKTDKSPDLFRAMGRFVHTLAGRYTTAEDVGTSEADMMCLREVTPYVSGLPRSSGGSGDPSPYTSLGIYEGLLATAEAVFGNDDLKGKTVSVQGVGNVGFGLAKLLRDAGAKLILTDVNESKLSSVAAELGAEVCSPREIYAADADIFAPCALGAILNDRTIPQLKCKAIAGGANNQLAEDRHGEELLRRGILYAPDFVINAGGIINVSVEFAEGGYDEAASLKRVKNIRRAIEDIVRTSREQEIPTSHAALVLAKKLLDDAKRASAAAPA